MRGILCSPPAGKETQACVHFILYDAIFQELSPVRSGSLIIERYLLKDILATLVAITLVLTVIYVGNRFILFLTSAAVAGVKARVIFTLLALKGTGAMVIVLPMALYLSILFVFGRLYRDSEMTALTACGVGMGRIVRTVLLFSLAFASVVAFISLYLKPWAEEQSYKILDKLQASAQIRGIASGRFTESSHGDGVFYVERVSSDRRNMTNVFVRYRHKGRPVVVTAKRAYQKVNPATGDRYMVLVDGHRYEGEPGEPGFKIVQFRRHSILVRPRPVVAATRESWALPTSSLWSSHNKVAIGELQWRLSMPLSALILAMLGVVLSRTNPRQGRFGKLFYAILVYIIYSNLLAVAQTWLRDGVIPPWVGLWWVHGLFVIGLLILFARHYGIGPLAGIVSPKVPAS